MEANMNGIKRKFAVFLVAALPLSIGGAWFLTGPAEAATDTSTCTTSPWLTASPGEGWEQVDSKIVTDTPAVAAKPAVTHVEWQFQQVTVVTPAVPPTEAVTEYKWKLEIWDWDRNVGEASKTLDNVGTDLGKWVTDNDVNTWTTDRHPEAPFAMDGFFYRWKKMLEREVSAAVPGSDAVTQTTTTGWVTTQPPGSGWTVVDTRTVVDAEAVAAVDAVTHQEFLYQICRTTTTTDDSSTTPPTSPSDTPTDTVTTTVTETVTTTVTAPPVTETVTTTVTAGTPGQQTVTVTPAPVTVTTTVPGDVVTTTAPGTTVTTTAPGTTVTTTAPAEVVTTTKAAEPKKKRTELSHTGTNETSWQRVAGLGAAGWLALCLMLVAFGARWRQNKTRVIGFQKP